jgi:hypothetical protein
VYICNVIKNKEIMVTTMKLAIETYAKLMNYSFEYVVNECLNGNEVIIENVTKLMFCVA